MLIHTITARDLTACAEIDRPCAGAEAAWTAADFRAWLSVPSHGGHVAHWDGEVVGFLLHAIQRAGPRLCLHRIGVAPRWRRRRVGSRLLQYVEQWPSVVPDIPILALVHERDLPMQCFLRANGLRAVQVCRRRCGSDDAYLFATPVPEVPPSDEPHP